VKKKKKDVDFFLFPFPMKIMIEENERLLCLKKGGEKREKKGRSLYLRLFIQKCKNNKERKSVLNYWGSVSSLRNLISSTILANIGKRMATLWKFLTRTSFLSVGKTFSRL